MSAPPAALAATPTVATTADCVLLRIPIAQRILKYVGNNSSSTFSKAQSAAPSRPSQAAPQSRAPLRNMQVPVPAASSPSLQDYITGATLFSAVTSAWRETVVVYSAWMTPFPAVLNNTGTVDRAAFSAAVATLSRCVKGACAIYWPWEQLFHLAEGAGSKRDAASIFAAELRSAPFNGVVINFDQILQVVLHEGKAPLETLKLLVETGKFNVRNCGALHTACAAECARIDYVDYLLQHGARLDEVDGKGRLPVERALTEHTPCSYPFVHHLLNRMPRDAFFPFPEQRQQQQQQEQEQQSQSASDWVRRPANNGGRTLLFVALECCTKDTRQDMQPVINRLLTDFNSSICSADSAGNTVFHSACRRGHLPLCKMLVSQLQQEFGYQRDPMESRNHQSNDESPARVIARQSVAAELNRKNAGQTTPLHLAALTLHTPLCRYLLDNGADVNQSSGLILYVLLYKIHEVSGHTMALASLAALLQLLVQHGADISASDSSARTALFLCLQCRSLDCAKIVVDLEVADRRQRLMRHEPCKKTPPSWSNSEVREEAVKRGMGYVVAAIDNAIACKL